MLDATDLGTAVPARSTLLGIPGELRENIIHHVILNERVRSHLGSAAAAATNTEQPQTYDFSVNALGFRCHSMQSFNMMFVNKQIHLESLAVVYRHCSVVLYAEATNDESAFGYVPAMLSHISPSLKVNAQNVTINFYNIAAPSAPGHEVDARGNLLAAVQVILTGFPQRKTLHIVAGVQGALQPELEILLRLFAVPDKEVISFEELWRKDNIDKSRGLKEYNALSSEIERKQKYNNLVRKAAIATGQDWFLDSAPPVLAEKLEANNTWRGVSVKWARRRVWKREKASSRAGGEMR